MRISSVLATGALLVAVPLGFLLAYFGFRRGLYAYAAVPFVAVGVVVAIVLCLFFLLPRLRTAERQH